ncbi:MAG: hypothetical protein ACKO1N_02780 [Erythrobacter sp.]
MNIDQYDIFVEVARLSASWLTLAFTIRSQNRAANSAASGEELMPTKGKKAFVKYVGGSLPVVIVPRGIKGWLQFAIWLALLAPVILWLEHHLDTPVKTAHSGEAIFLFCVGVVAWLILGLWWILAHSETVQMVEIKRQKQRERRRRQRQMERESDR